jgi:outer membrane protein insertion porin family
MSPRHLSTATLLLTLPLATAFAAAPARGQEMSTGGAITVPDGEQTPGVIGAVRVVGARAIGDKDISTAALKAAQGKVGEDARHAAVNAVRDLYRKRGYRMAQVLQAEVSADGTLNLQIAEGTIRHILIKGNSRTKSWAIRRTLASRPGDIYQEDRVRDDRNRLARLGIFEDVSITPRVSGTEDVEKPAAQPPPKNGAPAQPPSPAPDPAAPPVVPVSPEVTENAETTLEPVKGDLGDIDLMVRVKETATVDIQASLAYSDGLGAVGFLNLTEANLAGSAQRIGVQWQRTAQATFRPDGSIETSDARSAFALGYEIPPLGPRGYSFAIAAYDNNTVFLPLFAGVQDTLRSYEERRGFRTRFGRQMTNALALFATARRDQVGYGNVPLSLSPPLSELAASEGVVGALGFIVVADGRDAADSPQHGYLHSVKFEQSSQIFGGTLPFTQTTVDLRQYMPLGKPDPKKIPPVLAGRLFLGISSGTTPLSEQYYLGGYELLRGYDLFSISGDRALLSEVEARFPLGSGLQGVGFVEYGGAWQPGEQFGLRGLNADIGAGLRFSTPIGPIRLDAAIGSGLHTYISLGQSF